MAKLGFKDILMKYLKKDEDKIKEDAPANATGTAVAGTGDDSSTVVVKKKKDQQKKLMTRMGITEAINKAIPDLEYPKDEIRERTNQLKELASQSEEFKLKFTDPANKKKFHITYRSKGEEQAKMAQLKRDGVKEIEIVGEQLEELFGISSNANHRSKTIKMLDTMNIKYEKSGLNGLVIKGVPKNKQQDLLDKIKKDVGPFTTSTKEDLDAQPQDKDVKKVKGTQPKKYYKKLDKDTKKKRAAFFKKKAGTYKKSDDDDDYKAAPGDEKAKTKPSTFTKKFKKMYGDSYGYTAMHAKGIAKLNPLRRKDESK